MICVQLLFCSGHSTAHKHTVRTSLKPSIRNVFASFASIGNFEQVKRTNDKCLKECCVNSIWKSPIRLPRVSCCRHSLKINWFSSYSKVLLSFFVLFHFDSPEFLFILSISTFAHTLLLFYSLLNWGSNSKTKKFPGIRRTMKMTVTVTTRDRNRRTFFICFCTVWGKSMCNV